jgi:hypothetical protein
MSRNAAFRAAIVAMSIASLPSLTSAQVTFSTNRATWVTSMGGDRQVAAWRFFGPVLEGSTELNAEPAPNTDVGAVLTFDAPIPFKLRCMQAGSTFVFRDSLMSTTLESLLSIGRANVFEDDDLEITFPSGCVRGVGLTIFDNSSESNESLRVYDTSGNLIGTRAGLSGFIGIESTIPIGRIELDEHVSDDDIGVTALDIVDCTRPAAVRYHTSAGDWQLDADRFGTPEGLPATTFVFTAEALVQADEVTQVPADNTAVGAMLTFSGYAPAFSIRAHQPSAVFVFNDTGFNAPARPSLSIGRVDVHEDDDFSIEVSGCAPAVGFVLQDSPTVADEYVLVYGGGNALKGMFAPPPSNSNGDIFIGVIAPEPIARMTYSEDVGGDDIAIKSVSFVSPFAISPSVASVCQGGDTVMTLAAGIEFSNPRWRRNGELLADGPTAWGSVISGASTQTLTIQNSQLLDAATYDCVTDSACGASIAVPAVAQVCVGDFDCSGFVDTDDFTAFVTAFELGEESADVDRTGFVDTDDFTYFVLAFESGC